MKNLNQQSQQTQQTQNQDQNQEIFSVSSNGDRTSFVDVDDSQNDYRYEQTAIVPYKQTEKVTKAWEIFNGNTKLSVPQNGTLREGWALWRKTFNKFNGKTVTLLNSNFNESEIECIETPTKNYYILFLGMRYEDVTKKTTHPESLYLQFDDMTKEHILFVPVYSNPPTAINPKAGTRYEPGIKNENEKQKQNQNLFDRIGINTVINTFRAASMAHSFLVIRKLGLGEKDPETSYLDSMKFENSVHRETVTPDLPEIKQLIKKAKKQKDIERPQFLLNRSCVFYTYKFIFDMIKNDLYFDIDDKLAKFLDRNQFIDLDNGETDVGGPPPSILPDISTVTGDDMIRKNFSGITGYAKKVTSRLDILANMITEIICFQSSSTPKGPKTLPISLSQEEESRIKKMNTVNKLTKAFTQLDIDQDSPTQLKNSSNQQDDNSTSSDKFFNNNSIALITKQQAELARLHHSMMEKPEPNKLYDFLLTYDISDIVLVEKDHPYLKTFINKHKLLDELDNNTPLQDEKTVFYIIIGYLFLKLKLKLLNSEKRKKISDEEIQDFENKLHAICKDPVPLKAKIINMSNIIIYFLTVPNSITTQSP